MSKLGDRDYATSDRRYSTVRELALVLRYEWRVRRSWRSRRAAARGLWWSLVRRYAGELCQACGRPVAHSTGLSWWRADDALWLQINGGYGGTLCIPCFTRDAADHHVHVHWRACS